MLNDLRKIIIWPSMLLHTKNWDSVTYELPFALVLETQT